MIAIICYFGVGFLLVAQAAYRGWRFMPTSWDERAVQLAGALVVWPALVVHDCIDLYRERKAALKGGSAHE